MRKRILSILLTACMVLTLLPTAALAAENSPTKSIADSSLYFRENGGERQYYAGTTAPDENSTWIPYTGSFTITGESVSDDAVTNTVVVQSGEHNITLSNCSIGAVTDTGSAVSDSLSPFDIQGGMVNLTLIGSNQLYSANSDKAGLRVAYEASLLVTAASAGSLDARCHKNNTSNNSWGRAAGIGGNGQDTNGTIFIQGGEISAYSYNGAGIGGGNNTPSPTKNITVAGGTVFAQTSSGYGIGRGATSNAEVSVVITGGSVNALKGSAPSIYGTPQNSSGETVELYTFTLSGVSTPTAVTVLTLPGSYAYGITSMKTDAEGKLHIYMPIGKTGAVSVTTSTGTYSGSIADNAATLTATYAVSGAVTAGTTEASVSGLTVNLYASTDTSFDTSVGSATTNVSGAYTISGIPDGHYIARVARSLAKRTRRWC